MNLRVPHDMTRRHFLRHLTTSAATLPTLQFVSQMQANAAQVRRNQKACILMWMGGGPPTIDLWDLKPGSKNGGEFKPISTRGDVEISEHLPKTATVMDNLSIVRSMSTREADHGRGRYYMHTSFVPNATVVHPTFGSIVSYELGTQRKDLEIPAFVSIGGASGSPGFLGMAHAPFVVDSNGQIRNSQPAVANRQRLNQRLAMLDVIETGFINSDRGEAPTSHKEIYKKAVNLMTSDQMRAFRIEGENQKTRDAYGDNNFGRGLLMARRLVENGVPFVEVDMGGWDLHDNVFPRLRDDLLPNLDRGIAALTTDLKERGLLDHVVLVWMGEFGRTPRITQTVGRNHWARSWSVVVGGGGLKGGQAVGATDADGVEIIGKSYLPGDIWATVAQALGLPVGKVYTSKRGRPLKLAGGGTPIQELIG